jgi:hypothetical protein
VADYCESPVLVICDVEPKEVGLPFTAYCSVNEVREVSLQGGGAVEVLGRGRR